MPKSIQTQIDALAKQQCSATVHCINDTNANGVKDAGESDTGARKVVMGPDGVTVTSDATSSDAHFAGFDPGTYTFTRSDFPAGYRLSNPTTPGGSVISVTFAPGEHKTITLGTTNAGTKTSNSSSARPTPAKPPAPVITSPARPATRPATRKWKKGIVDAAKYAAALPIVTSAGTRAWRDLAVKDWHITSTREWFSVNAPGDAPDTNHINAVFAWCGPDVVPTLTIVFKFLPTIAQTQAYYAALVKIINGRTCKVETGNEHNIADYGGWSASDFVTRVNNPAYDILHAAGITVISGAVTYDVKYVAAMIAAGLKCDMVGFHPYRVSAAELLTLLKSLVAVTGTRLLALSEFTADIGPQLAAHTMPGATGVQVISDSIAVLDQFPTVAEVDYFVAYNAGTRNSPQAVLTGDVHAPHASVFGEQCWAGA